MAIKATASTNGKVHQNGEVTSKKYTDDSTINSQTVQKASTAFDQKVHHQASVPIQSERDFYISKFVNEYGMLPDVAAAQYDQLHS